MKKILVLCMSIFMGLMSIYPVDAKENITIYNITYGEFLEIYVNEWYKELSADEKDYYDSIPAYEILGFDTDDEGEITVEMPNAGNSRLSLIATTTTTPLIAKVSNVISYGLVAKCNGFASPKIIATALLIRDSDGKIMTSKSETKYNVEYVGFTEKEEIDSNKEDVYYTKAVVIYYAPDSTWVPPTVTVTRRTAGVEL